MDRFLTVEQASEKAGVKPLTIYRWIKSGKIKAEKFLDRWLIEPKAFDKFLKDR